MKERPILFSAPMTDDSSVPAGVELKPIPGMEFKYSAGSDGHIYCYSNARVNAKKPRPFRLAESMGSEGYQHVAIIEQGKRRTKAVHVLICIAFHGKRPSAIHEARHLDGNAVNARQDNLAWGTPAENEADKKRHNTAAIGSKHGIAKLNEEAVRILRLAIPQGLWNAVDAAKVFGVGPSTIRAAVSGRGWKHVE